MSDIWYFLRDCDRYVFHYTKAATLVDYILATGRLRFSKYAGLNDPYESKAFAYSFFGSAVKPLDEWQALAEKLNRVFKETLRFGCFTRDSDEAVVRDFNESGVSTIARAYERGHSLPRMWAQYAENHQGACLIFDREALDRCVRSSCPPGSKVIGLPVTYRNHSVIPTLGKEEARTLNVDLIRSMGFDAAVDRHVELYARELFFQKNRDWRDEREYRWLVFRPDSDDHYVTFGASLVGIALGPRFPADLKRRVGQWASANANVSLAELDWQNGCPQISPTHGRSLVGVFSERPINLFGLERSVYTRIVRLALEEKAVEYRLNEVEIFGPQGVPCEHLARHPFGRIPALEHDGFQLYETSAIARYVDEAFAGVQLQPQGPQLRARMNQVIGLLDAYAYEPMVWGVFVERIAVPRAGGTTNESKIVEAMAKAKVCLDALEQIVACKPFLLGAELTLADLHAFPMLKYFSLTPEGHDLIASHPALSEWLLIMESRPSVRRTRSSFEETTAEVVKC